MGSSEMDKAAKEKDPKTPPASHEASSTANTGTVNADWSGFQAYSPIPPHGFLASSPQAPPYMWGVQHIMPPYGTPSHPYVAMYPHGGIYAHPSLPPGSYPFSPFAMPSPNGIAEASGNTPGSTEMDGKPPEVKEKLPIKRSKGSLGSLNMITGKNSNLGKTSGASNGVSKSGGSGGTSEGSDADSQNESQLKSGGGKDSEEGEGSQNGCPNSGHSIVNTAMATVPTTTGAATAVPGPTTNLHIGMDYWGTPASSNVPGMHTKVSSTPVAGGIVTAASRDSVQSQLWLQDEREHKRQRRKQSNRESARRSRLRKQAECDELAQRAEALKEENAQLRSEVGRLKSEYEQLHAENASLKERLGEVPVHEERHRNNDEQTETVHGSH
ncbi:putative DNAJ heat shock N-terminal domain-containing protein [Hibiscus syriacus]|uniref:DNAJ heat shock N-terminal domain-containing protein n=1 Tax=Hibiscus syriacus TaxID=106335 RepID=A0A6A2XYF4_HIBSY|nr:bZIP transcription factor 16-like [Hibiscus syriacus]XP_039035736.1 bZIP transcription factor 16-like [Hibiscus syriacus]KAE8672215.1 putative DNAJ heat shock N-terminal domain-containing protein [Hibiscus syriacus]